MPSNCDNVLRSLPHLDITSYPTTHLHGPDVWALRSIDPRVCHQTVVNLHTPVGGADKIGVLVQNPAGVSLGVEIHFVNRSSASHFAVFYQDHLGGIQPCSHYAYNDNGMELFAAPAIPLLGEVNPHAMTLTRTRLRPEDTGEFTWLSSTTFSNQELKYKLVKPTVDMYVSGALLPLSLDLLGKLVFVREDYSYPLEFYNTKVVLPPASAFANVALMSEFTLYNAGDFQIEVRLMDQHRFVGAFTADDAGVIYIQTGCVIRLVLLDQSAAYCTWAVIFESTGGHT